MKQLNKKTMLIFTIVVCSCIYMLFKVDTAFAEGSPKVIIEDYQITEGRASAGEAFKTKFTVKNQSKTTAVDSVLITFDNEDNTILPIYGQTNQIYIQDIPAGSSVNVDFSMKIAEGIVSDVLPINFRIEYSYGDVGNVTDNNVTCLMELEPSCTLDIITLSVSDVVYNDGDTYISFYGKNSGNVDIKNLTMIIDGNIDDKYKMLSIGNIQPGSTKNQDLCISISEIGQQALRIKFTYQDASGNQYSSEEKNFTVEVKDEEGAGNNNKGFFKTLKESTWQIYALIGAIVAIIVLIVVYRKIKKNI